MDKIKAQLVEELTRAVTQLVPQIVDQMVPAELPFDKESALSHFTAQELLAEIAKRVG